jgi:DNA mismatch endonuclease, patch repair protein
VARAPTFLGLSPASRRASEAARSSSRKRGTRCELDLRRALRALGVRYGLRNADLPGLPDLVFRRQRVVVFCDGDFWHGRDLDARVARLAKGHNGAYWVAKLKTNVERDARNTRALKSLGWKVLRYWEGDVMRSPEKVAASIARVLARSEGEQRTC